MEYVPLILELLILSCIFLFLANLLAWRLIEILDHTALHERLVILRDALLHYAHKESWYQQKKTRSIHKRRNMYKGNDGTILARNALFTAQNIKIRSMKPDNFYKESLEDLHNTHIYGKVATKPRVVDIKA